MFHEWPTATKDMGALPGVLGVSAPAAYRLGTPRDQNPAVARWHAYLHGLATAIHETSGLNENGVLAPHAV